MSEVILRGGDVHSHAQPNNGSEGCVPLQDDARGHGESCVGDVASVLKALFSLSLAVVCGGAGDQWKEEWREGWNGRVERGMEWKSGEKDGMEEGRETGGGE